MAMSKVQGTAKAAAPASVISLAPSSFVAGGGLLNDVDVNITDAGTAIWNYDNKSVDTPALGIEFTDDEGKTHEQYYSAGKLEHFVPNDDGSSFIPVADKTALTNSCNASLFLASLVNSGCPEALLATGNVKSLIGMRVHVLRVPQPKRGNEAEGAKVKEICIVNKIISLPGESGKAKTGLGSSKSKVNGAAQATTTAASAQAAAATGADTSDLDTATTEAVIQVLGDNGGSVAQKALAAKVFGATKGNPLQKQMMKRAIEESFLSTAGEGLFTFDGTTVTLAE